MAKKVKFIRNYSRIYDKRRLKLFRKEDLVGYCKQFKIKGYSGKNKDDIIELIMKNQKR